MLYWFTVWKKPTRGIYCIELSEIEAENDSIKAFNALMEFFIALSWSAHLNRLIRIKMNNAVVLKALPKMLLKNLVTTIIILLRFSEGVLFHRIFTNIRKSDGADNMKLKSKTAGLVGMAMGIFIILLYLFIRPLLLNDAKSMDEESLRIDKLRVSNYIASEADDLQRLNRDWAVWDDTYQFVQDQNQQYIDSNIMFETFENNAINLMMYFNNDRELVYSSAYDLEDGSQLNLALNTSFIEANWNGLSASGKASIIAHEDIGSMLTVSEPILTSEEEGPSVGMLVMGKILNDRFFEKMERDLAIDVTVLTGKQAVDSSQAVMPAETEDVLLEIVPVSDNLALEVKKERKYYNEKLKSMNDLFLALSLATLMLVFFVYYLLDLFVLSRISFLSGQLKNIDFDQPNSLKIEKLKDGKDEITDLEKSVHSMLQSLEKAHSSVTKIAYFDYLTSLPNRFSLYRDFDSRTEENPHPFALLFFDLDGFKRINDLYGHGSGDELLQKIAERLTDIEIKESHRFYRIGGDEFILLVDYSNPNEISKIVEQIMQEIRKEFMLTKVSTSISTSIGISFYPADGNTLEDLLHFADSAMYEAKKAGKNNYYYYQELDNKEMHKRQLKLKETLTAAIAENQFFLEYQPIMNIYGNRISRVEALVRWRHPEYGVISPLQFIPLAEEIGAICPLGDWVLRKAVEDMQKWNSENNQSLAVAVNVSNFQLKYKENLLNTIDSALQANGFPANMLQIEITESDTVVEQEEVTEFICDLKKRDIRVALDDFGVGSSSLFQLTNLDIDVVKIDRSFLKEVPVNIRDTVLLRGIFGILNDLGIEVVTEGIETLKQLEFVADQQVSYLQGYYFSKPVPLENLLEVMDYLSEKR